MNHRDRMQACISGSAVDRPPVALWRHFPIDDQDPATLSRSIIHFQQTYDFDFVKITPASSYCLLDYGVTDEWRGNPEGTRDYTCRPIKEPGDWLKLPRISPTEGDLAATLEAIRQVRAGVEPHTPIIQTIFDPMSQAKNLAGNDTVLAHMRNYPAELMSGLNRIAENTLGFVRECNKLGIDGIFFAIQHGQSHLLNESELEKYVIEPDTEILGAAKDLWMNLLHLHGKNVYFRELSLLPASIVNWHDQETPPNLAEGKTWFKGAVCGGMKQWSTLAYKKPAEVVEEAHKAINSTNGDRFILGTGCVLPIIAPHSNISALRQSVEESG